MFTSMVNGTGKRYGRFALIILAFHAVYSLTVSTVGIAKSVRERDFTVRAVNSVRLCASLTSLYNLLSALSANFFADTEIYGKSVLLFGVLTSITVFLLS